MSGENPAVPAARGRSPWVDVHAHPGRCFLAGLPADDLLGQLLGGDGSDAAAVDLMAAGMAAVSFATVTDLSVIGARPDGSLYARREFEPGEVYDHHRRQLSAIRALAKRHDLPIVRTAPDIEAAHASGVTGLFVTCEGADFVEGDYTRIAEAHETGVRSITIVHYRQNEFGDLQTEPALHGGLSAAGRELVRAMNEAGMVVDLAHATFETTIGALEESIHPLMISHTHLAGGRSQHPRLVSDEHALAVADGGGLIGAWPSGVSSETFDDFVDEVARLVELIGVHHVAIGTDMDANYKPVLTDYHGFADIEAGLLRRGFSQAEADRVLGGNAIDLIRSVCG
ncbi:MAG: membrane dipeptidase [Ilumatobacteraceae bacterium]